ncbi:MAG: hypothetical protein AAGA54_29090 [Myxococcota bacterium]
MLIHSLRIPALCCALLALAACDKEESLGDVDSDSAGESGSTCPTDAMECPDGSFVGRSGPECAFDPCPGESDSESTTGVDCPADAMECPDGTVVGRSGPDCEFDPCPGDTDGGSTGDDASSSGGDDLICPPSAAYHEAATCPTKEGAPFLIEPGCYQDCDPGAPICDDASTCLVVETNPCICDGQMDCCAACASETALCIPVSIGEACDAVVGAAFESVDELECGITPDGINTCNWTLSFSADGQYAWTYSDVGEGGGYACKDGLIILDNNPGFSASYDPNSGTLTWDGVDYVAAR